MATQESFGAYLPARVLRAIREAGEAGLRPQVDRFPAAALFVDISGFTDLADRLGRRGPEGTEQLSAAINACFHEMLRPVLEQGGDVLTMAGDAMVAVWEGADDEGLRTAVRRAAHCAQEIQRASAESARQGELTVRCGIGVGGAQLHYAGGIDRRLEILPMGAPLQQMGEAGRQARPRDVVVSPEAWELLDGAATGSPLEAGYVRLESVDGPPGPPDPPDRDWDGIEAAAFEAQIPKPLHVVLKGAEEWFADIRPVTSLFVELQASQEDAGGFEATQRFVTVVQRAARRFEGTIVGASADEKGHRLFVGFGLPPASHEDDPLRAVRAAMAIRRELEASGSVAGMGLATGRVFCGIVGNAERRELAVMGCSVNLAARLAGSSNGEIFCDEATFQRTAGRVRFAASPPLRLKNISAPVPAFVPTGRIAVERDASRMLGHEVELATLTGAIEVLRAGRSFVALVDGEAGIGKSTLLLEWSAAAARNGVRLLRGAGESVQGDTPYFAWREVVRDLLGVTEADTIEERRGKLLAASRGREWERLAPLLGDILELGVGDNAITEQITGKTRADNLRELVAQLVAEAAAREPLAIVLEDGHWMDSASLALAEVVVQRVQPLVMLLSARILSGGREQLLDPFLALPHARRLRLEPLSRDDCVALAAQRLCVRRLAPPVADLVVAKSQGNPFFSVEIVFALREQGFVMIENDECRPVPGIDLSAVTFPDNVQGIIMRRVDALAPEAQLIAKVASVIGGGFSTQLIRRSLPVDTDPPRLAENLGILEAERLVRRQQEPEFVFTHALVEEAIYSRLLLAQRKMLHERVALALESENAESVEAAAPLLGRHWLRAGDERKAGRYFGLAGQRAVRSGAYQEGLAFLTRALDLSRSTGPEDPMREAHWQVLRAEAFFGLGKIEESWRAFHEVASLLGRPVVEDPQPCELLREVSPRLRRRLSGGRRCTEEEIPSVRLLAESYEMLSLLDLFSNRMAGSLSSALESLHQAERLGDSPEYARALALMAVASSLVPSRLVAERFARGAMKVAGRLGHESTTARVREFLGMYQMGEARWAQAEENLREAIRGFQVVGDRRREIECTCLYSTWNHYRGHFAKRVEYGQRVFELATATGDLQAQAWGLLDQIESLLNLGDFERVRSLGHDLRVHLGQNIYGADEIMAYGLLAALEMRTGRLADALPHAERALAVMTRFSPTIVYNLEAYAAVAEVFLRAWRLAPGNDPARDGFAAKAREACEGTRRFAGIFRIGGARALLLTGIERELSGDPDEALRLSREGLAAAVRLRMPYEEALAHRQLARLLPSGDRARQGELGVARDLFRRLSASYDLGAMDAEVSPA